MKSHTKRHPSLDRLLQQWQHEHRELVRMTSDLRWWSSQMAQADGNRFAEMGDKLAAVRDHLCGHFDREVEIGWELPVAWVEGTAEVEAAYREAAEDHQQLLERLDQLIGRLRSSPLPFDSWQDALDELDLFLDSLDEHEEIEETSLHWVRNVRVAPDETGI